MDATDARVVSRETKGFTGTRALGDLGERLAAKFLKHSGHSILARNYSLKFAEIDIISIKNGVLHFSEVKSVSHETKQSLFDSVSRGTWRPEEKVTETKIEHIKRAASVWLEQNTFKGDHQFNVIAVRVVPAENFASVNFIENVT